MHDVLACVCPRIHWYSCGPPLLAHLRCTSRQRCMAHARRGAFDPIRSCYFPTGSSASHTRHARATSTSMRRRPTNGRSASSMVRFTLVRPRTFEEDPMTSTREERHPSRSTRKETKATCFQHARVHATATNPSRVVRGTREDATPRLMGRCHGRNKPKRGNVISHGTKWIIATCKGGMVRDKRSHVDRWDANDAQEEHDTTSLLLKNNRSHR